MTFKNLLPKCNVFIPELQKLNNRMLTISTTINNTNEKDFLRHVTLIIPNCHQLHNAIYEMQCNQILLLLHHDTSTIITYSNRSPTLSPRLDLSGFCPGTETKQEVWLLRTGFGIAPVNKLVSLTCLLWALRSFRSFTLHKFYPPWKHPD